MTITNMLEANGLKHISSGQRPRMASQNIHAACRAAAYANFSVSPSQLDQLIGYIDKQEEHHQTLSFQDEFRKLLGKYNIEFDERYVWD